MLWALLCLPGVLAGCSGVYQRSLTCPTYSWGSSGGCWEPHVPGPNPCEMTMGSSVLVDQNLSFPELHLNAATPDEKMDLGGNFVAVSAFTWSGVIQNGRLSVGSAQLYGGSGLLLSDVMLEANEIVTSGSMRCFESTISVAELKMSENSNLELEGCSLNGTVIGNGGLIRVASGAVSSFSEGSHVIAEVEVIDGEMEVTGQVTFKSVSLQGADARLSLEVGSGPMIVQDELALEGTVAVEMGNEPAKSMTLVRAGSIVVGEDFEVELPTERTGKIVMTGKEIIYVVESDVDGRRQLVGVVPTTRAPTTRKPTKSPTGRPTRRPTTAKPTRSPTTRKPTRSPTERPTRKPTTEKPTKKPTTAKPTRPPTCFTHRRCYSCCANGCTWVQNEQASVYDCLDKAAEHDNADQLKLVTVAKQCPEAKPSNTCRGSCGKEQAFCSCAATCVPLAQDATRCCRDYAPYCAYQSK